jgi:outer membrane protein TolC
VQFTLQHHPNSTLYKNEVQLAKEKIRENRAAYLPSVNGYGSFDYNLKLQTSIIPAGALSDTETRLQIGNKFSTGVYVQADQTIFDRSANLGIQSARVEKEIADLNLLKENESLIYNAAVAYYEVLTYAEKGKLLAKNEAQHQQLLDILRLRYEKGVAKKSEYDRGRVNLNNIRADVALNESNYALAVNKLKNAMGMDLQTQISLSDSVNFSNEIVKPDIEPLTINQLLAYQIDQKNVLQKELDIKKKNAAYLPTLTSYAKYGANAYSGDFENSMDRWFDYSAVGVKLNIPIFSGFKRSSQLNQSKLSAENQRLRLNLNQRQYDLDYQNSGSQLFNSYTSLAQNRENLELAKEVLDATQVEYREGTATLSTFLDDDYAYKEAQSNYITSLIDYLNAQLKYEQAKGTLATYIASQK